MRRLPPLVAALVVALALAACGGGGDQGPVEVGADAAGSSVRLDVGQELRIALGSNPSTGYAWAEVAPADEAVLELVSDAFVEGGSDAVGAPGTQVLTYRAVGQGQATVSLAYLRSFEENSTIDEFSLSVEVE
ncbi:MAG: protease inhibitor I42 family protein [Thermoleophilia bacterium]